MKSLFGQIIRITYIIVFLVLIPGEYLPQINRHNLSLNRSNVRVQYRMSCSSTRIITDQGTVRQRMCVISEESTTCSNREDTVHPQADHLTHCSSPWVSASPIPHLQPEMGIAEPGPGLCVPRVGLAGEYAS